MDLLNVLEELKTKRKTISHKISSLRLKEQMEIADSEPWFKLESCLASKRYWEYKQSFREL